MKICILDGSQDNDPMATRVQKLLSTLLDDDHVKQFTICDLAVAPCTGCFYCWIKSPGICKNRDDNRLMAESMIQSDLLILLTPITFGGYSSLLKRGLDHLIQNISPFFTKIGGETHHKRRYKRYPNLAVIGWTETPDDQLELIFRHLVGRNSINFNADKTYCSLFNANHTDEELASWIRGVLEGSADELKLTPLEIPTSAEIPQGQRKIKKALLLVGSPRKEKSSSYTLGTYLLSQLQEHSLVCETALLYAKRDHNEEQLLYASIEQADLVILAFGLYVDSLPSPVIGFLERFAKHREKNTGTRQNPTHCIALANCGFPEASHNDNALAIVEQFSKETGFLWEGGIGLGGGNGLAGIQLNEEKYASLPIRKALDLASVALARGASIPQDAIELANKMPYPTFLFRFGAQFFWKAAATKHGARKNIGDTPYIKV